MLVVDNQQQQQSDDSNNKPPNENATKAYKLFSEEKKPVDVAVKSIRKGSNQIL
jgi:hypothetical protein